MEPFARLTQINTTNEWFILKIEKNKFDILEIGEEKIWLCSINDFSNLEYTIVDFISDEQLIKWANDLIPPETRLSKKEIVELKNLVKNIQIQDTNEFSSRKNRVIEIFENLDVWQEEKSTIINQFLSTEHGKMNINRYLDTNRQKIENEIKNQHEEIFAEYDKDISQRKNELEEKNQELINLEEKLRETKDEINQHKQRELDQKRIELQLEINELAETLKVLQDKVGHFDNIQMLREEIQYNERKRKEIEKDNSRLENLRSQLSHEVKNDQDELLKKLSNLKSYIDILNGVGIFQEKAPAKSIQINKRTTLPINLREFILEIKTTLGKLGREYEEEALANYLINIQQSFLTIFSGFPGTGKTSLITYLAKALGLEKNNRLQFIPVARGWTSQKNLLGFYNPLNGKFQPSSTGMYEILEKFQEEKIDYPFWFLLDEANLSPIEHYWSAFMAMCDNHREKIIYLGDSDNKKLTISDSIRFIATINYDNTTELLSPRIIDRTPVITLNSSIKPLNHQSSIELSSEYPSVVLSQKDLDSLFSVQTDNGFTLDEERLFDEIVRCLSEKSSGEQFPSIYVSHRKRSMMEKFCSVSRNIMKKEKYELRAFDIAISQHILPIINGNGTEYRKRLDKFLKLLNDRQLTHSSSILQQLIFSGETQYHFYHFFG